MNSPERGTDDPALSAAIDNGIAEINRVADRMNEREAAAAATLFARTATP